MSLRGVVIAIAGALVAAFAATNGPIRAAQAGGENADELARSHFDIGMTFLQKEQYAEALKDFQTVVDSFPASRVAGDALLEIARYQFDVARDVGAAETTTETIIRKHAAAPAAAFAYVLSGRIVLSKRRTQADVDTAIASFGRVPQLYPGSDAEPSSIYYWGEALRVARRDAEALEKYRDLTLKYPTSIWSARARLGAAQSLIQSGRAVEAMSGLQRIRTLFPGTQEAERALNWNTMAYRLYVRGTARAAYAFSGRMLGGTTQRYHDVMALCVDSHDNIFVAERAAVLAFNPHGEFVRAIASPDLSAMFINRAGVPVFVRKGGWQLENNPLAPLAVPQQGAQPKPVEDVPSAVETSRGEWLIADRKAKMVQLFSSGKYVRSMASGIEAERLALNDVDDLAMLDRENKMVVVADREGKILRRIARRGAGWALENPVDLAFDAMGHLYVLDRDKATVFVFAPDGKLLVSFAVPEKAPGAFERASALGVDSAARLYIFDEHTQHVHIYQ